jgi:nucleoside-diphosphate-sugar epimerase
MRTLVTGCAGFIGSHLSEELLGRGHEVVGVDCFTDYYARAIKDANLSQLRDSSRFTLAEVDLAEVELAPLLDGIDIVYHQAAQPGVRGSWGTQFETYVRNNVMVTQRLLEAAVRHTPRPSRFVYASSSSIYGNTSELPTNESISPKPVSPYGVTKLAGEHLVQLYWRSHGLPTLSLRYFSVYGPRQRPDMAFHRFIQAALCDEPLYIFGNGEQTRDFTFVSDAVAANIAAGESRVVGMAINVGGGSRVSINTVIDMLGELLGRRLKVEYLPVELGDVQDTSADTFTARKLLGFTPTVQLEAGLAAELEWIQKQFHDVAWARELAGPVV